MAQAWIELLAVLFGEFLQERFGPGGGGEDARDGGEREGAEANGTLQGLVDVACLVVGQEDQELLGLELAVGLLGQQTVEELDSDRPPLLETLA